MVCVFLVECRTISIQIPSRRNCTSINTHPRTENPHQRDVYLEIIAENGYTRWMRAANSTWNLLEPPIIPKEVLLRLSTRCAPHFTNLPRLEKMDTKLPAYATIFGDAATESRKECVCQTRILLYPTRKRFPYWRLPSGKPSDAYVLCGKTKGCLGPSIYADADYRRKLNP